MWTVIYVATDEDNAKVVENTNKKRKAYLRRCVKF